MLKDCSASDGVNAGSSTRSGANNSPSGRSSSPHYNCNPFLSSPSSAPQLDSADYYTSLFAHNCKSPSDTSFDDAEFMATERQLVQASFVLEYQQLYNRYTLCLAHLQESLKEINALRQENEAIRLSNADLVHRLSLLSQATIQNCLLSDFSHLGIHDAPESKPINIRPPLGAIDQHLLERRNHEPVQQLPKSISVRTSGYLKLKAQDGSAGSQSSQRATTKPLGRSQRVYVPGVKREDEAQEFEVYNQGMIKTELCNKWQETGACPYGENCQFAHGIKELRPVIRHPRYKTEICRMVMAGDKCPYGHRCHFRHSIAEQDRLSADHLH